MPEYSLWLVALQCEKELPYQLCSGGCAGDIPGGAPNYTTHNSHKPSALPRSETFNYTTPFLL